MLHVESANMFFCSRLARPPVVSIGSQLLSVATCCTLHGVQPHLRFAQNSNDLRKERSWRRENVRRTNTKVVKITFER